MRKVISKALIYFLFLGISNLVLSCNESDEKKTGVEKYFDVKGFIENQVRELEVENPLVLKVMQMGSETTTSNATIADWKKELELFLLADINKPAYTNSYLISKPDSVTFHYSLKPEYDLPVRKLVVKLNKPDGYPIRINALLTSQNKLYQSEKNISLNCSEKNGQPRINQYVISGFQKLTTMEKKTV